MFFSLKSPETTRVSSLVPSHFQPSIYAWVLQKDPQHNNGFRKKWIYGWLHTTKVDNVIRTVVLVKNSHVRRQHNHIFPLPMASYLYSVLYSLFSTKLFMQALAAHLLKNLAFRTLLWCLMEAVSVFSLQTWCFNHTLHALAHTELHCWQGD